MQLYSTVLFCLVVELLWSQASGIRWLAIATLGSVNHIEKEESCDNLQGLVKRQVKICRRNVEVMDAVKAGANKAIGECQFQFQNRRWNCSTVDAKSVFGNVLNQGTREAAFVHAMSSAGVAHSVTRACSAGSIDRCGCDRSIRGKSPQGFEWAGCSDNVAYGSAFSKSFVDARERARGSSYQSSRALMNLHNNEAGRRAVNDFMKVQCKCHGVSGSCELKTCWRAMPTFRDVGLLLKEKFDGATEVKQIKAGVRRRLEPTNSQFKHHADEDLVYLEASPDFCEYDLKTGSLGTTGRLCNKSSRAIDGCELMCCGRGYNTRRKVVVERCQCKFHWCCYVKCQKCTREVEEHYCR